MIDLKAVHKTYGAGATRVEALRDLTLHIAAGEFASIMGPSGSGKSTLLNLVSALDLPSAGQINIAGRDLCALDDDALTIFRRRTIGLVFQFFNLLPTLDALENVLLPVMLERKASSADREHALALLSEVGLEKRAHHRLHELSGGETQRVAIARALVLSPKLLLADEPTGNLDSRTGEEIVELFVDLHQKGNTIILVTHEPRLAARCPRALRLVDGLVVADGGGREVAMANAEAMGAQAVADVLAAPAAPDASPKDR